MKVRNGRARRRELEETGVSRPYAEGVNWQLAEYQAVACNYCCKTLCRGSGQTLTATLSERRERDS